MSTEALIKGTSNLFAITSMARSANEGDALFSQPKLLRHE